MKTYPSVRLVGEGRNEIISALKALELAEQEGLDLVLVSNQSSPPVVRIQDYKKIEYEKKKAKKSNKPKQQELKEIQFKVNISDHDFNTKLSAIRKFLERGDKVKVTVRLKGREKENPERAQELISKVASNVKCKLNSLPGVWGIAILEPAK